VKFEPLSTIAAFGTDFMEDDGSLRLYNLPETKVCKAVRGLGSDVSSIAWVCASGAEIGDVWVAAGQKVVRRVFRNVLVHEICQTLDLPF